MRTEWRPEWGPESVHDRIMAAIRERPLSRAELARALGHKSVTGALRRAVDDLMHAEFVSYTIPEKPGSRLQRYRAIQGDNKGTKGT